MRIRPLVCLPAAAVALIGLAGPAQASATAFHEHDSMSVVGDVFVCSPTNLTVTGGTIDESFAGTLDANGISHFTGTIVPKDVTLTDGTNTYTLSGASWFGFKGSDPDGIPLVSTETDHFVIHDATGGVFAKVQVVMHLSPNGRSVDFDGGQCEEPSD